MCACSVCGCVTLIPPASNGQWIRVSKPANGIPWYTGVIPLGINPIWDTVFQ